ncbi:hypothetical protein ACFOSV_12690 [Algoriphagus namhaensis]|uniref:RiboL-PSP-HEPN domain-containing protein n=1 Tax=Algoriphagus namhaensis TaxID=915353 RepID=A0ABV8ASX0_9BACT
MHRFSDLVSNVVSSTLHDINRRHLKISEELQTKANTSLIIGLKTLKMQKAILVTGMFSMFEAELQKELSCENGFKECKKFLLEIGNNKLVSQLQISLDAINVLKHGKGRSYNRLVEKSKDLPFVIKLPNQDFFFEGDVSEIKTLIEVDDDFINYCLSIISDVDSAILNKK